MGARTMTTHPNDAHKRIRCRLAHTPRFVTQHIRRARHRPHRGLSRAMAATRRSPRRSRDFEPEELVEEVKKSGLRGRGGAGFATGMKWSFLPKDSPKPRYLCVNADESEPGTFKDRMIMEVCPHQLVEGTIISSLRHQGASRLHLHPRRAALRGAAGGARGARSLRRAGSSARTSSAAASTWRSPCIAARAPTSAARRARCSNRWRASAAIHASSRRSRRSSASMAAQRSSTTSRRSRPFRPSCEHGADAYAAYGTEKSKGTRIYCLSGHVERPGNYELPLGTPLRTLIEDFGGGVRGGKQLKAIIPGGSSTPLL